MFYRCLESWKKYCPDYEIIEWNENNFDISIVPYVKEAYEATDFARLWIDYQGGIYLDTDVELLKPLDSLLKSESFFGYEDENSIATGLGFDAVKENSVVKCMLQEYFECHFLKEDGTYDKTDMSN